jgi:hypothetical protein
MIMSEKNTASQSTTEAIDTPVEERSNRRRFLTRAGALGLGALAAGQLSAGAQDFEAQGRGGGNNKVDTFSNGRQKVKDEDILNFALNLEYLEAEYYLRAAFGTGLSAGDITGTGTLGGVSGGSQVPFATDDIREYAEEIARDEEAHVRLLRSALGNKAVARPAINLSTSFTVAARAAGIIGPNATFNPFADENSFLLGAFIFEDVGVTAYKGAAPLIKDRAILEAAAGLLAVEGYHAGEVRTILYARDLGEPAGKISDLRDAADGPGDKDQGILGPFPPAPQSQANIVPTDANGLAFSRTFLEVLRIVYLGGQSGNFGFFPNGLNGEIR